MPKLCKRHISKILKLISLCSIPVLKHTPIVSLINNDDILQLTSPITDQCRNVDGVRNTITTAPVKNFKYW